MFLYRLNHRLWKTLDWIFPPECASCRKIGYRVCDVCFEGIQQISSHQCLNCLQPINENPPFCSTCKGFSKTCKDMAAWGVYDSSLRESIHSLKYHRNLGLGDFFASYLIKLIKQLNWNFELVVPIPLSKQRHKERGYNQSTLLSRPIAWYFKVEHDAKLLTRTKQTETQFKLSSIDREMNMRGAFSVNPATLNGKRILLVDDIITTGATMNFAASALLEAGASDVFGISIAKAIKQGKST